MTDIAREIEEDSAVYKTLLESTKAIPWKIDWASMQFAYIGPQIEALLGWTPGSWLTVNDWSDRMHPEDREWVVNFCVSQSQAGIDHEADYRALNQEQAISDVAPAGSLIGDVTVFLKERLKQPLQLAWSAPLAQQQAAEMQTWITENDVIEFVHQQPLLALVLINRTNKQTLNRGDAPCLGIQEAFKYLGEKTFCELAQRLSRTRVALTTPALRQAHEALSLKQTALREALGKLVTHHAVAQ